MIRSKLNKFDEIERMLVRASEQVQWLARRVVHPDPNLLAKDCGWLVEESPINELDTLDIRISIGECAGGLRNALNYLMCIFAEQDSGRVGKRIQFPIENTPQEFKGRRNSYLEGISDVHLTEIERYQPYNAGNWLKDLQALSNWYRHTGLIEVHKEFHVPPVFPTPSQTYRQGRFKVEVNSGFIPAISLTDGRPVVQTLQELHRDVSAVIYKLRPFLAKYFASIEQS